MAYNVGVDPNVMTFFIVFQYCLMFVVFGYWYYTRRIKRGFKVWLFIEAGAPVEGSYSVTEGEGENPVVLVERDELEKRFIKLGEVEVKAGATFVNFQKHSYELHWDTICFRDFGFDVMMINITRNCAMLFYNGCHSLVNPSMAFVAMNHELAKARVQIAEMKTVLFIAILLAAFVGVVCFFGGWFGHGYFAQQAVNATVVG